MPIPNHHGDWSADAACRNDGRFIEDLIAKTRRVAELQQVCHACPVLAACRTWASRYEWTAVVVAGWAAPNAIRPTRPPWAQAQQPRSRDERPALPGTPDQG